MVNAEFKRITTINLESKFFSQLDLHSENLIQVYAKKGGVQGRKMKSIMVPITQTDSVDVRRERVLKGLCVYLNEDPEKLVRISKAVKRPWQRQSLESLSFEKKVQSPVMTPRMLESFWRTWKC